MATLRSAATFFDRDDEASVHQRDVHAVRRAPYHVPVRARSSHHAGPGSRVQGPALIPAGAHESPRAPVGPRALRESTVPWGGRHRQAAILGGIVPASIEAALRERSQPVQTWLRWSVRGAAPGPGGCSAARAVGAVVAMSNDDRGDPGRPRGATPTRDACRHRRPQRREVRLLLSIPARRR